MIKRSKAFDDLRFHVARIHRRKLCHTNFLGVTGSCGKTTTARLVGAALSSKFHVFVGDQPFNGPQHIAKSVLSLQPGYDFFVHEMGACKPGVMERSVRVFRPRIGVVVSIGHDQRSECRSLEATSAEKGILVASLPTDGTAVSNADDPHVLSMRRRCQSRVLTFGLSTHADVRGLEVTGSWPDRLALTVNL